MREQTALCAWCGQPKPCGPLVRADGKTEPPGEAEALPCCSEVCRDKAARYFRFARRALPFFILLLLASVALVLSGALGITGDRRFPMAGMLLLGVTVCVFPFPTSGTIERFGVRRSIWLCRGLGVLAAACSLLFLQ